MPTRTLVIGNDGLLQYTVHYISLRLQDLHVPGDHPRLIWLLKVFDFFIRQLNTQATYPPQVSNQTS